MESKFYITTSIVYTNALPHLGYALELIQADTVSRYQRLLGKNVFFLTGTDEHGQKVVKAAEGANKSPEDFTDDLSAKFKSLTKVLNISNDDFIRTTDKKRHWPVVQEVWQKLKEKEDICKKKYQGLYCVGCEAFIKKTHIIAAQCCLHNKEPEIINEENYFFKLSKYSKKIEEIIRKDEVKITPDGKKNEMLNFIKEGLEDVSFSRPRKDLNWGIPVPDDDSQTIYVWADALLNYLSALGGINGGKFKEYWPADIQCMGKDILRFHATIWLGMLLSLELPLPKNILVHGFINSGGQKMSKSLGNVVDPFELVKKYGVDSIRYFLLREIPATEDGDFTQQKLEERYNADLASGLGNLVARVITMAKNNPFPEKFSADSKFEEEIKKIEKVCKERLEGFKFNEALMAVWELISFCDKRIEEERPWEGGKEKVISDLLIALGEISRLIKPFLPETAERIQKQLKTQKSEILFPRLD